MTRPITFLSDYGSSDEFAGVCRAVIARIAPEARVIDLTHGITGYDVREGATVLARALAYAPAGIHLAVVDPGVGSERRALAARSAKDDRLFVGPDNGLLAAAIEAFGGAVEAIDISGSPVRLEPVSATFHGRDLFAPVAAHLALGSGFSELGEPIDPGSIAALESSPVRIEPGTSLTATVAGVDRFGNASLDASPAQAAEAGLCPGGTVAVEAQDATAVAAYAPTFSAVPVGELLLYRNSSGGLGLGANRASAAERLGLGGGDQVVLRPA